MTNINNTLTGVSKNREEGRLTLFYGMKCCPILESKMKPIKIFLKKETIYFME